MNLKGVDAHITGNDGDDQFDWIDDGDYRGVKIAGPHIRVGDEVTYEIPYSKRQERHGIVERVYQRETKDGPVETARVRWPDGGFGYAKTADLIEVGDIG